MNYTTAPKPFDGREILAAARDAIAIKLGAEPACPHPLAQNLSARDIAYAVGANRRTPPAHENELSVVARGLRSSQFAALLADGAKNVTVATFDAAAQEHLQFTATTFVEGFKAERTPAIDGDLDLLPAGELAEIAKGAAFAAVGGAAVQLSIYARIVMVSRHLIFNDQLGALKTVFGAVGAHAAQKEASILAETLSANPLMDDGAEMFNTENTVTEGMNALTLGQAMGMLRNQKSAAGNPMNLRAAHLVVSPEQEFAARQTVLAGGVSIKVSALAGLPAGRWFVLPDPAIHPVISVLRMVGTRHPLRLEHKAPIDLDGTAIRVAADLGAAFLRRAGVIRGGSDLV